jgi:hypothetical protein
MWQFYLPYTVLKVVMIVASIDAFSIVSLVYVRKRCRGSDEAVIESSEGRRFSRDSGPWIQGFLLVLRETRVTAPVLRNRGKQWVWYTASMTTSTIALLHETAGILSPRWRF